MDYDCVLADADREGQVPRPQPRMAELLHEQRQRDERHRSEQQDALVLQDPKSHHFPGLPFRMPQGDRVLDLIKTPVFEGPPIFR